MPRARVFRLTWARPAGDPIRRPARASQRGAKLPRLRGRTMAPRVSGRKVDAVGESPKYRLAPSSGVGGIGPAQSFLGRLQLLMATRHGAGAVPAALGVTPGLAGRVEVRG